MELVSLDPASFAEVLCPRCSDGAHGAEFVFVRLLFSMLACLDTLKGHRSGCLIKG